MAIERIRAAAAGLVLTVLVAAAPAAAAGPGPAPADEYFGRMRMSVLGIRNELANIERSAAFDRGHTGSYVSRLAFVDDAMRDWRAHYPDDNWLPRFAAQRARINVLLAAGTARNWVFHR